MKKALLASLVMGAGFALATSALADNYLADRHAQRGLQCAQCHVAKVPSKPARMEQCLKCHGGSYEELAKRTADSKPNPHYTHLGDKECAVCHKGHKAPQLICNDCHKFKMQVP